MDVKEYISSGVLELYAMGALSSSEMKGVEEMCASNSEVALELKQVQDSLNNYAKAHQRNPRPEVRSELMNKIASTGGKAKVVQMRSPHELTYKYLIAACIASLIISTFASVFFYQKWSEAEDRYVAMVNEKNVMAQNLNVVKYNYDKMNHDMSVMRDPAISIITLRATDSTKYYMAHVMWNKYTRQTFIDVSDLPAPGQDKQYQLWALMGGQPVDAGVFDMPEEGGMQKVKAVADAEMWAVTLEPKGGSNAPTMDQMVLMSKI
ncbi:MAG: anti-sigma factor [Bacteroidetes bacterium]|nr:anti-sigma factor [Bacteroidota bacterium]